MRGNPSPRVLCLGSSLLFIFVKTRSRGTSGTMSPYQYCCGIGNRVKTQGEKWASLRGDSG